MNTHAPYEICMRACMRMGLVGDVWYGCILPRLDELSVDMLAIALGCSIVLTTKHFIRAIMQRELELVKFIMQHVPAGWRVRMCAEFYGDEIHCHLNDPPPYIARKIQCYAGKADPLDNWDWGFRTLGNKRTHDCRPMHMNERVLPLAAIGQLSEFENIPEVLEPGILYAILRIALLFEQHNVIHWCLAQGSYVTSDHFTHARDIETIRLLHAHAPTIVPASGAYINAFGTPAYAELCAIAEFRDHDLCQRVYDGAPITDRDMLLTVSHQAAMVFGRVDLFKSRIMYTMNTELNIHDHNIISIMHAQKHDVSLPIRIAMMHGRVDTLAHIRSLGVKFRSLDMINAILLKDKHPAVLEWMFSMAEYVDM